MPPSCFFPHTWGADVASARCSPQTGSPRPSRPLLKIIRSILLLLDWLWLLDDAPSFAHAYMFSAPATLFKLRLAPFGCGTLSSQPEGPSERQRGWSQPWIGFRLFTLFGFDCAAFISVLRWIKATGPSSSRRQGRSAEEKAWRISISSHAPRFRISARWTRRTTIPNWPSKCKVGLYQI